MKSLNRLICAGASAAALTLALPASAEASAYRYDVAGKFSENAARDLACRDTSGFHPAYFRTIGASSCAIAPAGALKPNSPPTCGGFSIGPIPNWVSTFWTANEDNVLSQCSDSDGGTLSVVSPSMPYRVDIPAYSGSFYVYFTVSDGQGGTAQMYVYVMHG